MPIYEMICPKCEQISNILAKITDYDDKVKNAKCTECSILLDRYFDTPPNFTIGAKHTYNGQTKVSGVSSRKQQSRVPINIIDEMPDGSTKVTRIGRKEDVDND